MNNKKIVLSGTWIVDYIKFIDYYPQIGYLSYIRKESIGIGGGPHNVGINLRRLDASLPLYALGKVGKDEAGEMILEKLKRENIDTRWMKVEPNAPTSYTDVMTEIDTGRRTFFHNQGANALLNISDFPIKELKNSIFYLGYLMALPSLEKEDKNFGNIASRLFSELKAQDVKIALDLVSMEGEFKKTILPTLKYVDYFIINELEAEKLTDIKINNKRNGIDINNAIKASKILKSLGVKEYVIIHFPQGAVGITNDSKVVIQPSLSIPPNEIVNTLGAGDAFFAGVLYGTIKKWDIESSMELGVTLAGACLFWETTTGDIDMKKIEDIKKRYGFKDLS